MGVHNLLPFLREKKCFETLEKEALDSLLQDKTICVDVPIFVHKFIYKSKCIDNIKKDFVGLINSFAKTNTRVILVFDGAKLALKEPERLKRGLLKNKQLLNYKMQQNDIFPDFILPEDFGILWPTSKDYEDLYTFLISEGHECRKALYEAEALCAHLVATNEAFAALTEDSDCIAFGCPRTILNFYKSPELASLPKILDTLELSLEQFQLMCTFLGNDFCENVRLIGPFKSYQIIKKYKTLQAIQESHYAWPCRDSFQEFAKKCPEIHALFKSRCYEVQDINK